MGTPQSLGLRKFAESGDSSKLSNRSIQKWIDQTHFFLNKRIFLHEIEGLRCIGQKKETF